MKNELTAHAIEVMQAHVNGRKIQRFSPAANTWEDAPDPRWDWLHHNYRITPVPAERWMVVDGDGRDFSWYASLEDAKVFVGRYCSVGGRIIHFREVCE
jgi:hypothetical protein